MFLAGKPNRFSEKILNKLKKVSIKEIADGLALSKSTVSLVLNGRGDEKRISLNTQERVIKYATEQNYKPNQLARGLSTGKSEMIGLIVPNISDNFYARIARRIERKARHHGYNVIFSSSSENPDREKELIYSMLDRQVEGLIIASTQKNKKEIERLKNMKFPFVLIDRHYPDIDTNFVVVDNAGGITRATEELIRIRRKRIGFISIEPGLEAIHQRLVGYRETMKIFGLSVEKGFVRELSYENYETEMSAIIRTMVEAPIAVDGIVFATHYLTASGLRELKKLNIQVPQQVAIVSFDQMNAFDLVEPPITAVIQPVDEIGDRAVDILLKNLQEANTPIEQVILKTDFVCRKSCCFE